MPFFLIMQNKKIPTLITRSINRLTATDTPMVISGTVMDGTVTTPGMDVLVFRTAANQKIKNFTEEGRMKMRIVKLHQ